MKAMDQKTAGKMTRYTSERQEQERRVLGSHSTRLACRLFEFFQCTHTEGLAQWFVFPRGYGLLRLSEIMVLLLVLVTRAFAISFLCLKWRVVSWKGEGLGGEWRG